MAFSMPSAVKTVIRGAISMLGKELSRVGDNSGASFGHVD